MLRTGSRDRGSSSRIRRRRRRCCRGVVAGHVSLGQQRRLGGVVWFFGSSDSILGRHVSRFQGFLQQFGGMSNVVRRWFRLFFFFLGFQTGKQGFFFLVQVVIVIRRVVVIVGVVGVAIGRGFVGSRTGPVVVGRGRRGVIVWVGVLIVVGAGLLVRVISMGAIR